MKTVLIAEDEPAISQVLKVYLQKANYHVVLAANGIKALELFSAIQPSLVLLDVMLPGLNGWGVLKKIRHKSACPVIMLTALSDINYRLNGLNEGADDYITKPFIADEVVARVSAVLRRSSQLIENDRYKYFGSLIVDVKAHIITLNGVSIDMTPRDLSLFLFLALRPNRTFTREMLIEQVWGLDYDGSDRAVDLSIKRIRKSLQNWPSSEGEIKTLRGLGYQFCVYDNK